MNDEAGANYERSDIDAGTVGWIAGGLALFVLIVPLVMPLVFPQSVHRSNPAARPALSADVPPLEVTPSEDLQRHGHADRQFADTYGWIDRDRKIARIPVARAVDRLLQTGLPGWPSP